MKILYLYQVLFATVVARDLVVDLSVLCVFSLSGLGVLVQQQGVNPDSELLFFYQICA